MIKLIQSSRRLAMLGMALVALGATQACTESILEADDPDLIRPSDLDNPDGAAGLRLGALSRLRDATAGGGGAGESPWLYSGLLADEYASTSTFAQNDETDKRSVQTSNSLVAGHFRDYFRARTAAMQALVMLKKWLPTNKPFIAEMYFVRGFAEMSLAQDFCNGIPLSSIVGETDISGDDIQFGAPQSVEEVFAKAAASFDTALITLVGETSNASVRIRNAARIGKARALLATANTPAEFAAAAAPLAVDAAQNFAAIPTSFGYSVTFVVGTGDNAVWTFTTSNGRYAIGDSVEGNARNIRVPNVIPFLSARDPRLPADYVVDTTKNAAGVITQLDTAVAQDGQSYTRIQRRHARSDSMAVVNGIDARLIEAEAQLAAANITGYLATLNALRTGPTRVSNSINVSGMAALTDPGTPEARVNQLFRERAFWTFGRGQRLNDLRRLIRNYGRAPNTVFPEGQFHKGGVYGGDLNFPIPQIEQNNPNAPTGCTDRNA
jgi:starch-binding outer membrane protein, SusD/RagB family